MIYGTRSKFQTQLGPGSSQVLSFPTSLTVRSSRVVTMPDTVTEILAFLIFTYILLKSLAFPGIIQMNL